MCGNNGFVCKMSKMRYFLLFIVLGLLMLFESEVLASQTDVNIPETKNEIYPFELDFDENSKLKMAEVFKLLKDNNLKSDEEKINLISEYFLNTPYVASRLVGSNDVPEKLVIALNELDCFTFLDYLESFKRSTSESEFIEQLQVVRYINGNVSYLTRKHFYSDWYSEPTVLAEDLLATSLFSDISKTDIVDLNQGASGVYIPNLDVRTRDINYIPRENITVENLAKLKTGDYIGFRRNIQGLDVTHTGLIIQKDDGTYLRHASSSRTMGRFVQDGLLITYLERNTGVIGILLFRSNSTFQTFKSTVTIEYVDEQNNVINPEINTEVIYGADYNFDVPKIEGYEVKDSSQVLGKATEDDINIRIVYTKLLESSEESTISETEVETVESTERETEVESIESIEKETVESIEDTVVENKEDLSENKGIEEIESPKESDSNKEAQKLPDTGEGDSKIFILAGVILFIFGVKLVLNSDKKLD